MESGKQSVRQPASDGATPELQVAQAELQAQLLSDPRVLEVWKAEGAKLLTVYVDNGEATVGMELESGDWFLVRVSDPVDVLDRIGGGLVPLTK